MTAAGVGGPITGKGAHLLIVDDPVKNDEEARSATFRQKQWDWWQSVATTRLRPGALIVVIQTRWHRDDLTGRILHQASETGHPWRVVKFPALAEEHDALGRAPGEALWPEVFSKARLETVRQSHTNYYWQALYQQQPQAEGSAEWPDAFFGPDIWFNEWPPHPICRVVALDPRKADRVERGANAESPFIGSLRPGREGTRLSRHTLRKRFRTACKVIGAERLASLTIHHGRHTFISHALAGGRTLAEVRDAAGHANVSITSRYLHIAVDDQTVGQLFAVPPASPV